MVKIIVIAALAANNVIGNKGDIPWRIKGDFLHFKDETMGHPCIMGDKTYESLPQGSKPLPGRENIVLTFDKGYNPPGAKIMHSFEEALGYCKDKDKVFICGGATIYRLGLKFADILELTRLDRAFDGDTFFPEIDLDRWDLIRKVDNVDEVYGGYSFLTYVRKRQ